MQHTLVFDLAPLKTKATLEFDEEKQICKSTWIGLGNMTIFEEKCTSEQWEKLLVNVEAGLALF